MFATLPRVLSTGCVNLVRRHGKANAGRLILLSRAGTSAACNKLFGKLFDSIQLYFIYSNFAAAIDAQAPYTYKEVFERSIRHPEEFWAEEATKITWMKNWDRVLDNSNEPFTKW